MWNLDTKETTLSLPISSHPHVHFHGLRTVGVHHSTASKPFPYLHLRTPLRQATEGVVIPPLIRLPPRLRPPVPSRL